MPFFVSYHSAGCLPDSDPIEFDSLRAAADHIFHERQEVRANLLSEGINTVGQRREDIRDEMGIEDPTPGSLYRWSIEEGS